MDINMEIPCVMHTDNTVEQVLQAETSLITIYELGAISPLKIGDKEYSIIHSQGNNFIIRMTYAELKQYISERLNFNPRLIQQMPAEVNAR